MVTVYPTLQEVGVVLARFSTFHLDETRKESSPITIPNAAKVDGLFSPTLSSKEEKESKLSLAARKLKLQAVKSPLRPHNVLSDSLNDIFTLEGSQEIPAVVYKPGEEAAKRACTAYNVLCINNLSDVVPCTTVGEVSQLIARRDLDITYEIRRDILNRRVLVNKEQVFTLSVEEEGRVEYKNCSFSFQVVEKSPHLCQITPKVTTLDPYLEEPFQLLYSENEVAYLVPQRFCYVVTEGQYCQIGKEQYSLVINEESGEVSLKPRTLHGHFPEGDFVKMTRHHEDEKDQEVIVPRSLMVIYTEKKVLFGDQLYKVCDQDDGYQLVRAETPFDEMPSNSYVLLKRGSKKIEIVPESACELLLGAEGDHHVLRHGTRYSLELADWKSGTYRLVGKNVTGIFQEMVRNIYTGEKGHVLDIRNSCPMRDKFYEQISLSCFIRAFLAMVLLRHEDGKISALDESNFLFEEMSCGQLRPIIIDLDDALPETNGPKEDGTHRIRNGLMAFPQARVLLQEPERLQVRQLIEIILQKSKASSQYIEEHLGPNYAKSYQEVIEKLQGIIKQQLPDTLEALFFVLFPDYEAHWKAFRNFYDRPEELALFVGESSPSQIRV